MAQTKRTADQWKALSEAQRKRYIGAARTGTLTGSKVSGTPRQVEAAARKYYISGGSLQAARGKHQVTAPKRYAPPREALQAAQRGEATPQQLKQLRTWQQKRSPKWIRQATGLSEDTAAILVNVNLQPQNWKSVDVFKQDDGSYLIYIKSKKGGPDRKVILPDEGSVQELVGLIRQTPVAGGEPGDFVRIIGYTRFDALQQTPEIPAGRQGSAIPRKRK